MTWGLTSHKFAKKDGKQKNEMPIYARKITSTFPN